MKLFCEIFSCFNSCFFIRFQKTRAKANLHVTVAPRIVVILLMVRVKQNQNDIKHTHNSNTHCVQQDTVEESEIIPLENLNM